MPSFLCARLENKRFIKKKNRGDSGAGALVLSWLDGGALWVGTPPMEWPQSVPSSSLNVFERKEKKSANDVRTFSIAIYEPKFMIGSAAGFKQMQCAKLHWDFGTMKEQLAA